MLVVRVLDGANEYPAPANSLTNSTTSVVFPWFFPPMMCNRFITHNR